MEKRFYNIILEIPLGKRKGEISLEIDNNKLSGYLLIFQNKNSIRGTILDNELCLIEGKYKTLFNSIDFIANGKITETDLNLTLNVGNKQFVMSGCRNYTKTED